jgi:hypothetical protein
MQVRKNPVLSAFANIRWCCIQATPGLKAVVAIFKDVIVTMMPG